MSELTKRITIPLDGSQNALRSLDYLNFIYGPKHNLEIILIYILPQLPSFMTDKTSFDKETWIRIRGVEEKSIQMAERILEQAKNVLIEKGFPEERIKAQYKKQETGVASAICNMAKMKQIDTLLITRRGRSNIKTFFMGGVSKQLLDSCQVCPVWIVGSHNISKKVLIAVDSSENAMRAADHAAFMFSDTDCSLTLFHTLRHLGRFVPLEVIEENEILEQLWENRAGQEIAPYMKRAKKILIDSGIKEERITVKISNGSRSAADDIFKEAQDDDYGTIVLGRRGVSALKEFFMGSVTSKILSRSNDLAVLIVQ
ncbi:MAG: hypothetical protein B1H11_10170 [Desulfobacteraceae bacterium 4484_190.1]|nr:MAG: hypothetical protein B1H11_10170 [Desulfobacteraceae bacterium 4484_190.1]